MQFFQRQHSTIGNDEIADKLPEHKNELIEHHWLSLKSRWDGCKDGVLDETTRKEIDDLFHKERKWTSTAEDWYALNYAEQCVGAHLTATQVSAEYQSLVRTASERKCTFLDEYRERAKFFSTPPPPDATIELQRNFYLAFLREMQSDAIQTRFDRYLRKRTAKGLVIAGLSVLSVLFLLCLIYARYNTWSFRYLAELVVVALFGVLGAYFSRVMSFQSKPKLIGFEDVTNYRLWMLTLRALYGAIGAVVLYFFLRSGIISGHIFPNFAGSGTAASNANFGELASKADFGKLLVWSFIAGFSERLIPDTLERTESQADQSDKNGKGKASNDH